MPVLMVFSDQKNAHFNNIFISYYPQYEHLEEFRTAWTTAANCPKDQYPNQWDCAFLPMTNCTLPHDLESCTQSKDVCLSNTKGLFWSKLFDKTDADGKSVELDSLPEPSAKVVEWMGQQTPPPDIKYSMPYSLDLYISDPNIHRKDIPDPQSSKAIFIFQFMTRRNSAYRDKVL